jgi:hypothetical protein
MAAMTARRCTGTTRAGAPCRAAPLRGRETCSAHDPLSPAVIRFGSVQQASRAGARGGAAGRRPRVVDVIRERIEEDIEPVISALVDALTADRGVVVGQGENATVESVPDHDARIKAARELLDRAYGRARQALEHTGAEGGPIEVKDAAGVDLRRLSDSELKELEALLRRATPGPVPWSPDDDDA